MLKSPLLGIAVAAAALITTGTQTAVARDGPGSDFSPVTEWRNQISSDLEHNKRYLPDSRTRGRIGMVRFELTMNRAGWVLPGTRIVTMPGGAPPASAVATVSGAGQLQPARFDLPRGGAHPLHQRPTRWPDRGCGLLPGGPRRARLSAPPGGRLGLAPPTGVSRTPEGCSEARRLELERQRRAGAAD